MALTLKAQKIFIELPNCSHSDKVFLLQALAEDPEITDDDRKAFWNRLDTNTAYWAKIFMGHVAIGAIPAFHKEIYDGIDDLVKHPILTYFGGIVFRGAAKSTIKNIAVTKHACHQSEPVMMLISESEDQAIADLRSIQGEFESNDLIKLFYFNIKDDKTIPKGTIWNAGYIELMNGVAIIAKGMESRKRGFKHKNRRPTLIFMDDFESRRNLATEEMRKIVFDEVDAVIIPMGDVGCKFVFLNTIVSPEAYMQKAYDQYIEGSGIFASPHGRLVRYDITQVIDGKEVPTWESRYPMSWINAKRQYYEFRGELDVFYQEYYNIPKEESKPTLNMDLISEIDATFHKSKYVKYIKFADGRVKPVNTFIGVDPAVRMKAGNDFTCIFVVAKDSSDNTYLLDIFTVKIKEVEKPAKIMEYALAYGVDGITIETYGYQFSLYEWTMKYMADNQSTLQQFFTINEFANGQSKKQKYIDGLDPAINSGKVGYLKGCPNIAEMKEQGRKFSGGKRTHDDILDGFFLAMLNAYKSFLPDYAVAELIDRWAKESAAGTKKQDDDYLNWRVA